MYWHLLIEEFGPELEYVKGQNNIVADALSHLNILDHEFTQEVLAFGGKEFPKSYPLSFAQIEFEQQKHPALLQELMKKDT